MSTELIINASLPETRIALMENGEIQDLLIERATGKGIVGNIYKGRVTRVLPGMQAAFVDIGLEKAAFLYVDDVYTHSEMWETEELDSAPAAEAEIASEKKAENVRAATAAPGSENESVSGNEPAPASAGAAGAEGAAPSPRVDDAEAAQWAGEISGEQEEDEEEDAAADDLATAVDAEDGDDEEEDEDDEPVGMCPPPGDEDGQGGGGDPQGTVRPESGGEGSQAAGGGEGQGGEGGDKGEAGGRRRHRRGRRGGRFRKRNRDGSPADANGQQAAGGEGSSQGGEGGADELPGSFSDPSDDSDHSDRDAMSEQGQPQAPASDEPGQAGRPQARAASERQAKEGGEKQQGGRRAEFKETRDKGRRIKPKQAAKPARGQAQIQDLLKEGQEVIVQVAKDPIATKGARLTCHISLPGRHLVCMPTIDHVGVSRRIERDDERRKLREYVEKSRPKGLGFIVRTASGRGQSEARIKQDVQYLSRLWSEIKEKAAQVSAPAMVYEDLNSVLRAIRDWVTEDIDKIVVDSRYHYNDIQRFVSHFMPSLKQKVSLYNGDTPIFDAYNISTELARGMERKVWLKSGGYLVIDQAEALVAIDVNTGRFVGKKNLEDTILKTNLEAVQEIAYQLRLRNCGGIIILDLIDMEREENKQRVYRALEEALKKDRARPSILKISELGLVEMTRKRTRDTMVRALCESCSTCEGKGFVKSKVTLAYEIMRELERIGTERDLGKILVQAHPDVVDVLAIDERDTMDNLERLYRKPIFLQAVMDYPVDRFEVTGDKLEKGERIQIQAGGDRDRDERGGRQGRDERGGRDRDRGRRGRGRDRDRGRGGGRDRDQSSNQPPVGAMDYVGAPEASGGGASSVRPVTERPAGGEGGEGGHVDDDRLAFLRAQAAQDAALARMTGGQSGGVVGAPGERGPRGDRDRGGRGGRDRDRGRGGQGGGVSVSGVSAGGGDSAEGMGLGRAPVEEGGEGGGPDRGRRGRRGRRGGRHRRGGRDGEVGGANGGSSGGGGEGMAPRGPGPAVVPRSMSPAGDSGGGSNGGGGSSGGGDHGGGGDSGGA